MSRRTRLILALMTVALVVLASATGCSRPKRSGGTTAPVEATVSVDATAAADATMTDATTTGSSPSDAESAGGTQQAPQDASAVIRELDAIERELSGMDLPSETDFDSLEGEIR